MAAISRTGNALEGRLIIPSPSETIAETQSATGHTPSTTVRATFEGEYSEDLATASYLPVV
ncbi:hypothetical protein A6E92_31535 [Streptomyces sp. S8]|nr:hypothetical protein A6E92_31535 [Streptomyces sp. S8]